MAYTPPERFDIPMFLLSPTGNKISGVDQKVWPQTGPMFFGSFRTFGGTETTINGVYAVKSTATIETWYRPDIKAGCRIQLYDGDAYEIVGDPEDINRRHQYLKIRVERVKGGA